MNQKIVLDHIPLAIKMARIKSLSSPPSVSFEELESAAYMGLVKAATRFDPERGYAFSSYAKIRIEGEMKDYMRLSSIGAKSRFILDNEDFVKDSNATVFSFDMDVSCLDEREAKILFLYYIDNKGMKEIGLSEGVSESRVSQILSLCRKKLKRQFLKEQND
jgi:RNA polymerase sigma factor (sigma-70 family)